jgi:hypothetical protein
MLEALLDLARQPEGDKRRELLDAVASLFYSSGRDRMTEDEDRLFADVATRLLKDLAVPDRAAFAARVAADPRTPRGVALALAHDDEAVAAPVLAHSTAISEDDLVDLAHHMELGQRIAIATRDGASSGTTDATLIYGEIEVMDALLDNGSAMLSARAFEQIAERAKSTSELRERLCLRKDVPSAILSQIAPLLDASAQARVRAQLAAASARSGGTAPVNEKDEAAKRRFQIKTLARRVETGEMTLDAFVADLVSMRHPPDLALGLADLSLLAERQILNAVLAIDAEPLALICKALEVSPEAYKRAEELRRLCMKLAPDIPDAALSIYASLNTAKARRILRMVEVGSLSPTR